MSNARSEAAWAGAAERIGRTLALATVIALHLALGVWISLPPIPANMPVWNHSRPTPPEVQGLRLRWVPLVAVQPRPTAPPPRHQLPASRRADPVTPAAPVPTHARKPRKSLRLALPDDWNSRAVDERAMVMRGIQLPPAGKRVALPGGYQLHAVARFRMADPRSQGVAGVLRMVAGIFGAVDSHCVEIDAWRTMSSKEQAEQHLDPERIERTAREHGCLRPQRKPSLPDGAGILGVPGGGGR